MHCGEIVLRRGPREDDARARLRSVLRDVKYARMLCPTCGRSWERGYGGEADVPSGPCPSPREIRG